MVTFNCEVCNATVPKKNTEKHYYKCPNAYYSCIDCSTTFDDGVSYKQHTECISEDQKYQKGLYKGKKQKQRQEKKPNPDEQPAKAVKPKQVSKTEAKSAKIAKIPQLQQGESLYKILKNIKDKETKRKLLKSLVVSEQGDLVLQ